jgi:MYXO-CTERM domain-containing protein
MAPSGGHRALQHELRPTEPGALYSYSAGDVVERFDTEGGKVRVHYTRAGTHAVPLADVDQDGTPDFVQRVERTYGEVLAFYGDTLGYRAPVPDTAYAGDNGGDARFDVYLLDFGISSDGAFRIDGCSGPAGPCYGHVVQENDFKGYFYPSTEFAIRVLSSHELFHAVQAAYAVGGDSVLSEGSAVWASEQFDPTLDELEGFSSGYLSRPERSLDVPPPGPVPAFAYGAGVFFQFLSENYGTPIVRELWESLGEAAVTGGQPRWIDALDALLADGYGTGFDDAFSTFAAWNLYTGPHAEPGVSYADGPKLAQVATELRPLPIEEGPMRVFYASAQYFRASLQGRTTIVAALADDPITGFDDRDGLRLILTARTATKVVAQASAASELTLDTTGATEVVVGVVNPLPSGASRRPRLCVGNAAEVETCLREVPPDGGTAPPVDGGTPADEGTPIDPDSPASCGCTSAGGQGLLPALLLLGAHWKRRRRAASCPHP